MAKNWIAGAVKHPGALRASAKKAGAIEKGSGNINKEWIAKEVNSKNPMMAKRARLAQTFGKMRGKK